MDAAQRAFGEMNKIALRERARMLFDMRQKFEEHFDELSRVLTQDHGRTIGESRGSVRRSIENIESACSAAYGLASRILDLLPGVADDDPDVIDTGLAHRLNGMEQDRAIGDRHELLGAGMRDRSQGR